MRLVPALLLALALCAAAVAPATGQGGIEIGSATARNQFPDGVVFKLSVSGDAEITKVIFRYTIPPEGAGVYGEPECDTGTQVLCTFNLKSGPKLFLVPGANVVYNWEVSDAAGNEVATEKATFVYEDDRFEWDSTSEDNLTVWNYAGDESDVRELLQTGVDGLRRMESLLGTTVGFPVKVFLYESARDMRDAVYSGQGSDGGVITLGEVFFSDTALVAADVVTHDILRHELAHIVVRQAVKGPFGNTPAWLDEGTAVYAQSKPLGDEENALRHAIERDDVLSVRSMTSGSLARSNTNVSLFYGQAWSVVKHLIDTYGEAKYAQLFAAIKEGTTIDKALQAVYGFDQDGLDAEWRESVGLPPRESGGAAGDSTPVPQITPYTLDGQPSGDKTPTPVAGGRPEADGEEEDGGVSSATIVLSAAVVVLVVGGLVFAGFVFIRRLR